MTTMTRDYILTAELEWTMARMICAMVDQVGEAGYSLVISKISKIVRGGGDRTLRKRFQNLDSFGSLRFLPEVRVTEIIEFLLHEDRAILTLNTMEEVGLTDRGRSLLEGRYLGATGFLSKVYPMNRDW